VGDFNGDGIRDDLAVANNGSNNVSVFLGNGDGTFQAPKTYAAGSHPASVAVGDFTGRGIQDLAVANAGATTVSVFLGNGDGTFQAARNVANGNAPITVAVADLTGDGITDLVTVSETSNNVGVLLGNGDGTFQAARHFAAGVNPFAVAVGDFTGDGVPDLAVANLSGTTRVLLGNGDGTFQTPTFGYVTGFSRGVAADDFHDDGRLDLAVTSGGSNSVSDSVSILANDGNWDNPAPRGGRVAARTPAPIRSALAPLPVPGSRLTDLRPVVVPPTPPLEAVTSAQSAAPATAPVDRFVPEDVLVADRPAGASTSERWVEERLTDGFPDDALGPLWEQKVLEGDPLA
jgi:hypothetical protein